MSTPTGPISHSSIASILPKIKREAGEQTLEEQLQSLLTYLGYADGDRVVMWLLPSKSGRSFGSRLAWSDSAAKLGKLLRRAEEDEKNPYMGLYLHHDTVAPASAGKVEPHAWIQVAPGIGIDNGEVTDLRTIKIDLDPKRPKDTSATNHEKARAETIALAIAEEAAAVVGVEPLALLDSGNGWHLYVRLDRLPNVPRTVDLRRRFLEVLHLLYSTPEVEVDTVNFDARRIMPVSGTYKKKGSK